VPNYNGINLAFDYINAHGGVNGRPLEYLCYDDASTPEGAVKAANRLIEQDEVALIIGSHLSPNVQASMPYTEKAGIPMIGLGTGLSWTKCGNEYTFRGTMSGYSLYPTILEEVVEIGDKKVAFFFAETDLGQSARDWFMGSEGFAKEGVEVVAEVSYQKAESDFTGHIAKALAADPEAVVIIAAAGTETAQFIKQLRQQGFTGIVYGAESSSSAIITETAGDLANGLVFGVAAINTAAPEDGLTEGTRFVQKLYLETYGEPAPNDSPFRGWDAGFIVAEALRNVEDVEDPEEIRDALLNITNYVGVQGTFDYSAGDGDGLAKIGKYMIMDQKVVLYDLDAIKEWKAAQ